MVNTWTASYFQTDGVRVLFVLPQSWTDAFIPMTVSPTPAQIVRVMVGRVELLTTEREKLAESAVRNLASGDVTASQNAFQFLRDQGRYVEPIVRRVMKTTTDDAVRTVCRRLLLTDFLTELRAAVHNSADGTRLTVDPFILRAHLARLLREVGSDAEARAGARLYWQISNDSRWLPIKHLRTIPQPSRFGPRRSKRRATTARQPPSTPAGSSSSSRQPRADSIPAQSQAFATGGSDEPMASVCGVPLRPCRRSPGWRITLVHTPERQRTGPRIGRLAYSWHMSSRRRAILLVPKQSGHCWRPSPRRKRPQPCRLSNPTIRVKPEPDLPGADRRLRV